MYVLLHFLIYFSYSYSTAFQVGPPHLSFCQPLPSGHHPTQTHWPPSFQFAQSDDYQETEHVWGSKGIWHVRVTYMYKCTHTHTWRSIFFSVLIVIFRSASLSAGVASTSAGGGDKLSCVGGYLAPPVGTWTKPGSWLEVGYGSFPIVDRPFWGVVRGVVLG